VSGADRPSPRITRVEWGHLEVEGIGRLRDAKLWPGGGRAWDWNETNTRHVPGIQVADVEELVTAGTKVLVLSRGMQRQLRTCPETLHHLEDLGLRCHMLETREAVRLYNELAEAGEPVGGLFHSTC
jgi:hypothetical protein